MTLTRSMLAIMAFVLSIVLLNANLLDYTVEDTSGDIVSGSMTEPVKFAEEWSWARSVRTEDWRLEGIEVIDG